ncbi:MAG: hypothetical protein V7785_15035 [Bermanella sp.]
MKEVIQRHIGAFVIAVVAGIFSMIGAYIGSSPSQEKLNDSNRIKVNMELYNLLSPNLEITLHDPKISINSLFFDQDSQTKEIDIKRYLKLSNKGRLAHFENNISTSENSENFIGYEFFYCVRNKGDFPQFVRAPKLKIVHPIFSHERDIKAYRADKIGNLSPGNQACQKVLVDEKDMSPFGTPSFALKIEALPSESSIESIFIISNKEELGRMAERYLSRYTIISEASGSLLSNMDVDAKEYLLKVVGLKGSDLEAPKNGIK